MYNDDIYFYNPINDFGWLENVPYFEISSIQTMSLSYTISCGYQQIAS